MEGQYVTVQDCKGTSVRILLHRGELRIDTICSVFPDKKELFYVDNKDNIPIMLAQRNGIILPPPSIQWSSATPGYVVVTDEDGLKTGYFPVKGKCDWTTYSKIIGDVIISGPSLLGTTLSNLMENGYSVVCGIQVENWTRFPFSNPMTTLEWGYLSSPATTIIPATREAMVGHKCDFTATGTSGTASWLINGADKRLVVMWSAPFNFDFYSNYLAIGITTKGFKRHSKTWFNTMYYKSSNTTINFNRSCYRDSSEELVTEDEEFEVSGTMGTSHKPEIKVIVKPKTWENIATKLRKTISE